MAIEQALGAVYECESASGLTGAREQLAAGQFDLALCDTQVGGEAGLAFAEAIIRHHPGTAVILVTGAEDAELAKQAFAFGAHGYLVELLRSAALMHDVGKIGTPDEILRKPGPLAGAERAEMQRHTLIGHEILCASPVAYVFDALLSDRCYRPR